MIEAANLPRFGRAAILVDGSYNPRLFLPVWDGDYALYEHDHALLTNLSIWKGSDKRWVIDGVEHLGYEFRRDTWETGTLPRLREVGLTIRPLTSEMETSTL